MRIPPSTTLLLGALLTQPLRADENTSATPGAGTPPRPTADEVVQMEPVIVTADLWQTPLDKIAASVSVYDAAALAERGVRHFGDIADQIPNLTYTGGTSRPRYFQIRGIGENSQYEGETPDSSVRFLMDDFDFTGLGGVAGTFDVEQVEVLRGPQAGAFGANAAGGVVRLVSAAPTPYWTGRVEGTVGGDALGAAGVAISGPLIEETPDKLMVRAAVYRQQSDGFRRNVFLNDHTNARDELMARVRLTWNASDVWTWDGAFLFAEADNGFDEFALDNNGRFSFSDQPGRDEQRSAAYSLRGVYSGWQDVRLSTVSSATWVDSLYSYDDDWTSASYAGFSSLIRDRKLFSQELRLDGETEGWISRWTLGAYFAATREVGAYTNEDPRNIRGLDTRYRSGTQAVFAQAAHEFTDRTRAILGLRVEHVDLRGDGLRTRFRKGPGTFDPSQTIRPSYDDTMFGGKFTLEHDLTPNQLVFASLTRGYKAGGINVDARIDPTSDPLTYETETLWNYEVGLRGHWFEQRLTGELTAFYLDRHDTQVRDSAGFGGNYRFFTDNAERASVHGLETAATYQLGGDWSVHGSLALMDSELKSFVLANGNTGGGRRLANTPRYGYTLGLRYRPATGLFGNVEWVGRAEQLDSNNQNEARSSFTVVNAALGYAWQRWSVNLWVRNAFDTEYEKRVFFFGNEDPDYIETRYEARADPRQVGVTAKYEF